MSRRTQTRRTFRAVAFTTAVVCGCVGSTAHGNGLGPSTDPAVEPVEDELPPAGDDPVVAVGVAPVPSVGDDPVVAVGVAPVPSVGDDPVVAVGVAPVPSVGDDPVVAVGVAPVLPVGDDPVVAVGVPPVAGGEAGGNVVVAVSRPPEPGSALAALKTPARQLIDVRRVSSVLRDAAAAISAAIALLDARL